MIIKQPECQKKFKETWISRWGPAILKIAKADKIKLAEEDDMQGLEEIPEGYAWISYYFITFIVILII